MTGTNSLQQQATTTHAKKEALDQLRSAETSQRDLLSGAGSHRPRVHRMDHAGVV